MIHLSDIENKINEEYSKTDKNILFSSIRNEMKCSVKDINFKNAIEYYFYEIIKINSICLNKIESVDDIIFPLRRIIYETTNDKYGLYFIETKKYIYALKNEIFKYSDFYYEYLNNTTLDLSNDKIKKYVENIENIISNTDNKIKELYEKNGSEYLFKIITLLKEKFLKDYNNQFKDLFLDLVENTNDYYVFEKNIDESYEYLSEDILIKNKENIYELLKTTCKIENDKIEKGIFNNLYYSFIFTIPKNFNNAYVQKKTSLNMYSEKNNDLQLDYFLNGSMFMNDKKLFIFIFEDTNSLYYFGDIEEESIKIFLNSMFYRLNISKIKRLL